MLLKLQQRACIIYIIYYIYKHKTLKKVIETILSLEILAKKKFVLTQNTF